MSCAKSTFHFFQLKLIGYLVTCVQMDLFSFDKEPTGVKKIEIIFFKGFYKNEVIRTN